MGVIISRWHRFEPESAIKRIPDRFQQRTGLRLKLLSMPPGPLQDAKDGTWSLSVPSLRLANFTTLLVPAPERDIPREWNVEAEWPIPAHPYVWHQLHAVLEDLGFQAVRISPTLPLPDQIVPSRWDMKWSEVSTTQRLIYGYPLFWPLWW
jgi:hypothetical protein